MGVGIDGVAAVPSRMYGSWISNMRAGSQACYVNNNVCYKITADSGKQYTVAVWGKCGGYAQCSGIPAQDESGLNHSVTKIGGTNWADANICLNQPNSQIHAGTTPDCLINGGDGKDTEGKNCCPHPCQSHVDWCASNDHVHFDLNLDLYNEVCGPTPCTLKHVEPVLCPWNPPLNPAFSDWTPRFTDVQQPGSSGVTSVHTPYPPSPCESLTDSSGGGSTTPTTPTTPTTRPTAPTAVPTAAPTDAPSVLDCDSVSGANIPSLGSCAASVCTAYCNMLMGSTCASVGDVASCVENNIQLDLCPSGGCSCAFA